MQDWASPPAQATYLAFGYTADEGSYRKACPGVESVCDHLGVDFEELCRLRRDVLPALVDRWAAENGVVSGRPCFIATAAYGSSAAVEVVRLRRYRDEVLRHSWWGRGFIAAYECLSPPLARWLERSPGARSPR